MELDQFINMLPFEYVDAFWHDGSTIRVTYVEWEQDFGIFAKGQWFEQIFVDVERKLISVPNLGWEQRYLILPALAPARPI